MSKIDEALGTKPRAHASDKRPGRPTPAAAPARTKKSAEPFAYYDSDRGNYYIKDSAGNWMQITEASLKRHLKYREFADVLDKDAQFAMIDRYLIDLQLQQNVSYAGKIAGYHPGLATICGERVLITSGPKLIKWTRGDWSQLRGFVEELLGENVRRFYAWIKTSLRSLYRGPTFRPGPILAISGPPGCGKSLFQNLITEMLGGRSGKPYRYLTGKTTFNADLVQNEHLMVEDEAASTNQAIRKEFGQQLRNLIVNEVQSLHRKTRDALSATPFTRCTITLNDQPEDLAVLPPIDDSLIDKITLLPAFPFVPPYDPLDDDARHTWRRNLTAELPHFMYWLREWKIPKEWEHVRYGVVAYQDPELLWKLESLSNEVKLLSLIDSLQIWNVDRAPWVGTADELETRLLEKDKLGRVAKLLYYANACDRYLHRLCKRSPERFSMDDPKWAAKLFTIKPTASST